MKFPKLVIEEAKALREHATELELNNLKYDQLDPENYASCIYGQMTGSCFSDRATKLIQLCTKKVYDNEDHRNMDGDKRVYQGVKLNGSPINIARDYYFSPIEVFISKYPSKEGAGKLIKFLKGEIKTL